MSRASDAVEPTDDTESQEDERPAITCLRATETRTVFTEEDNTDGWIATDVTVDLRQ